MERDFNPKGEFKDLPELSKRTEFVVREKLEGKESFEPEIVFFRTGKLIRDQIPEKLQSEDTGNGVFNPLSDHGMAVAKLYSDLTGAEHFAEVTCLKVAYVNKDNSPEPQLKTITLSIVGDRLGNRIITIRATDDTELPISGTHELNIFETTDVVLDEGILTYEIQYDPWSEKPTLQ